MKTSRRKHGTQIHTLESIVPKPITPTCPTCNYDLTGLINQGSSATCPECNTHTTYLQAIAPRVITPTLKHAIIWIFAIPSGWMTLYWAQLDIGDSLQSAGIPYFSGLILMLYLPILSLALLIMEWWFRIRMNANQLRPSFLWVALIIFTCFAVSMILNWVVFMDWVVAISNL